MIHHAQPHRNAFLLECVLVWKETKRMMMAAALGGLALQGRKETWVS
jgi:hypothetical protein